MGNLHNLYLNSYLKSFDNLIWRFEFLWIWADKYIHTLVWFIIFIILNKIIKNTNITFMLCIAIAILKEVFDLTIKLTYFSLLDIIAGVIWFIIAYILIKMNYEKQS